MENKFLYIDQQEINNKVTPVQSVISEFKSFYERYKKLNLKELQSENLQEFFKTPKTFFLNVLTGGESLSVGQLKLDPEKVYDLSPRPSGVDELVADITKKINDYHIQRSYLPYLEYISISDEDLIVNPDYKKELTEKFTYYTTTEDQNKALTILTRLSSDLNELKKLSKRPIYGDGNFVENILKGGDHNSPFSPNLKTVLAF